MSKLIAKTFVSVAVLTVLGAGAALAEKKVKDQAEYDLYSNSTKTTDPAKRLAVLNTWKEKYPETDFKEERLIIYLSTYQQLNQPAKMVETSKEILALNPKNVNALMWLAYFTQSVPQPPTADSLAAGEKAAQGLLDPQKPEGVADDAWAKAKADFAALGHNTLAFIATQRKQLDVAEQEYTKTLQAITSPPCQSGIPVCPAEAVTDWSLATALINQKKPERYPEAIFYLARAASLTGPAALSDPQKKQAEASLVKIYTVYHGQDEAGLKELRTLASSQRMPPAGFKIKNKNEMEAENEEKFAKDNPQLALWKRLKDALMADNGAQYWESFKDTAAPKLKGKLVSQKPALRPKELVLSIDEDNPQVTLKLENPLPGKADPGTELQFEGVPKEFTKNPFMLTFEVDSKDKIEGWPAQAAPPAKKAAPRKKKAQ